MGVPIDLVLPEMVQQGGHREGVVADNQFILSAAVDEYVVGVQVADAVVVAVLVYFTSAF